MIIYIKIDLALNNLQRLICHKTQPTNHAELVEEYLWHYLTPSWEGVHAFPMSICPKVNVIARLEFELAYFKSAVQYFSHYTTGITFQSSRPIKW